MTWVPFAAIGGDGHGGSPGEGGLNDRSISIVVPLTALVDQMCKTIKLSTMKP